MRKTTAELFSTLDGIVSGPQHWHGPYSTEEAGRQTEDSLANSDLMLLGGNTYDEHAGYWPTADGRMAELMNGIAKLVVTSRAEPLEWSNSTQLSGDVETSIRELKEQDGGDILITGSVALVKSLLAAALVDELRLIVDPVVVGEGTRLFGETPSAWSLVATRPHPTGAVTLTYALTSTPA
ncbi:RibD domain-containing protein [Kribbella voronezhensis]|uniref:RibD domain-containing protein n=1 Tax=Kribbella voronezhensis TaxID=2512212 RepID=A0A4R7T5Y3_9ACTN|nr:dihydrofolate reductase family protein [Kribbella voronezhensis]TDU86979.1 RibD domain-containing protein [Kribbella voronezhensis]